MFAMSKKSGSGLSRAGSATGVLEAVRASTPATSERPTQRPFTAEYKRRNLREAKLALASNADGAIGEVLRLDGPYSSHLSKWPRHCDAGELARLMPDKRGRKATRNAQANEVERLQPPDRPAPTEEDFPRAATPRTK